MKKYINIKVFIAILIDFFLGGLSLYIANYIRLNYLEDIRIEVVISSFLLPVIFIVLGIYKRSWKYFSILDLWSFVKACLIANTLTFLFIFILNRMENIPRLVVILNFFTLIFLTGGARVIYRTLYERFSFLLSYTQNRIPILLIGDNDNAEFFIRASERTSGLYKLLGIVNENDKENKDFLIRGVPLLGSINNLEKILNKLHKEKKMPQKIIIVSKSIKGTDMSNIMKLVDIKGISIGRALSPNELISGKAFSTNIKDIGLEDLLGRRQNKLEYKKVKNFLKNQTVLITGAGGSIGSVLAKAISKFNIKKLILLDVNENAIYNLSQDFEIGIRKNIIKLSCSNIRNHDEMEKVFIKYKPDIIYHAAALKHVSICEENVSEAIRTNIFGTDLLSGFAQKYLSKCFILISTDKAVSPSSVMGATKKIAENIIQSKDRFSLFTTRFITVRFGNVLGSQGSVVPHFKKQIAKGGPLTVTHKNVSRFFMTIEEAVALVLNATLEQFYSKHESRGSISVLNMGASIKIDILAKQMIKTAGLTPNKDIKIKYTGLKKGEKMHENLYSSEEKKLDIGDKGFFLVKSKVPSESSIKKTLLSLKKSCSYINNNAKKNLFKIIRKKI